MAADNKLLGNFDLVGISPAARGIPQIEVTFDIDANGIVNVKAVDKATNKEQSIKIQASGGLSDDDIEKMVKDAEEHAEEDKAKKELIETKNQAESLIHGTQKSLTENSEKINEDDKKSIEEAIEQLKASLEGDDPAKIASDLEVLTQEAMKLGEAIYKAQESSQNTENENPEANPEDDTIVDADFEEVEEDKTT